MTGNSRTNFIDMAMSESGRSFKRKANFDSSASDRFDDASTDDRSSLPGTATYVIRDDGSFTQEGRAPRRRRKFNPQRRKEVAMVRKKGACKDCRSRKVRVCLTLSLIVGLSRTDDIIPVCARSTKG